MMTLTYGEFAGALFVAVGLGVVLTAAHTLGRVRDALEEALAAKREGAVQYSRGCAATRASLRDALTTLPRLHCSRSAAGHVRVAEVERLLLAEGHDG